MPGRQAHGRPLISDKSAKKTNKKSAAKARSHALDAFAIAEKLVPDKASVRRRDLDAEDDRPQRKHRREDGDDDDDDEEGDEDGDADDGGRGPVKKRRRRDGDADGDGQDFGSDSEGNEWHVGVDGDDEDSDIDSDEAFADSDEERFEGFTFRGSQKKGADGEDDDSEAGDGDEDDSLGEDAIDLAQALDQFSEDEDEEAAAGGSESGSEDEEDDDDDDSDSQSEGDDDDDDDDDDDEPDLTKIAALQNLISDFGGKGGQDDAADEAAAPQRPKLQLADLELFGVKDANIRKSVKLMSKEQSATKPGTAKKLEVPLAKRLQGRLDRTAAYEKTNETLERWQDTIKHNRQAEHLMFPLPESLPSAGLDKVELGTMNQQAPGSELEKTIMSIMEESGMGPSAVQEQKQAEKAARKEQKLSQAEIKALLNERRRDRELQSREEAKSKRIKKIKSKAYRRVHRKERLNEEAVAHEAMREAGEIDSEEEQEAQHRRRAAERMGSRHRESRWAKMAAKTGRAVWDDDFRAGLHDMARRDEDLRRRIEGRVAGASDDDSDDSDDSQESPEERRQRLLRELDEAAAGGGGDDDEPESNLMKMKFMRRAEEAQKKSNDELIAQIRRDLEDPDRSDGAEEEEEEAQGEVGRRTFGGGKPAKASVPEEDGEGVSSPAKIVNPFSQQASTKTGPKPISSTTTAGAAAPAQDSSASIAGAWSSGPRAAADAVAPSQQPSAAGAAGAWSSGETRKKNKKSANSGKVDELDLTNAVMVATNKAQAKAKRRRAGKAKAQSGSEETPAADADAADGSASGSEAEDALHLPLAIRDQELVRRAFAGEDVVGDFAHEKEELAETQDEKVVDNALPGWGSWVGDGVSKRQQNRNRGKLLTKVDGVKRKDRKDSKLDKVIINERRIKKNDKYLAPQMPHVFETKQQYERSLRMPLGPEWMTKQAFQDATKPRVMIKQGIIAPMSKPMLKQ